MAAFEVNPYKSSSMDDASAVVTTRTKRRWPVMVAACACVYYAISAITLPFTNAVWFGEIPPLAILQIPKSFIKSVVQEFLLRAVHVLGLSHGSASPDYIATHGWAMVIMAAAPALLLVAVFAFLRRDRMRDRLIAAVLIFALIDAIVTLWFDSTSSLKLYNASYF